MALIACAECGNQVSDKASACPKCGAPTASTPIQAPPIASQSVAPQPVAPQSVAAPAPSRKVSPGFKVAIVLLALAGGGVYAFLAAQERAAELAKRRIEEDQARREAERQQREFELRERVTANPGSVLQVEDLKYYDKGIINSYRTLISVSIGNKSKFALRKLSGQVEWLREDGSLVGASPFTLSGSIAPGDTKVFTAGNGTLDTGTIQGAASKARLKFDPAQILE